MAQLLSRLNYLKEKSCQQYERDIKTTGFNASFLILTIN